MLTRISDGIYNLTRGWVVVVAVVVFVLFVALVLPRQAASAEAATGGVGSPDTSFLYSADDLYRFAQAYGEQGRAAYVRARFTFDVIFPLVYGFFLTATISWVFARSFRPGVWRRANLVPLLGVLFDLLENTSTSLVMLRYPQPTLVIDTLAPAFTLVKWIFVSGSFGLLLVGIAAGVWRWFVGRRSSA
jgi:hypothetical protein